MMPKNGLHEFNGITYVKLDDYARLDRAFRLLQAGTEARGRQEARLQRRIRAMELQLPVRVRRARYAGLVGRLRRKLGR